jgi:CubicO group peptidase (beta-lactamase class C family)
MPRQYADSPLTIKHLLTFTSGVPHNNEPTWKNRELILKFRPGTGELYSTPGFGILGHVIEGVTGMTFDRAVKEYIGKPVGAASFWVEKVFIAPGARIHSSIYDMALMVTGMMNHKYFSADDFYNRIFHSRDTERAFVWPHMNLNTPDFTLYISGANGRPRAHIKLKPKKKIGVVLLARRKQNLAFELTQLGGNLLAALEHQPEDKIRKK